MEEIGRVAVEKAAKGVLGKVKSALGVGEAEIEVSYKGIRVRAPSPEKAKELLDYGAETQLKLLSQTRKALSKANILELEDSQVREKIIRSKEDCDALVAKPDVEALPEEERLRLTAFVLTSLGDREFHQKKFDMTEQAYHDAYELARKVDDRILQAICLNLIGVALGMQGKAERALPYFEQALRLEPGLAETWYNKGVTLHELNRLEEAVACYDKAVEINPDYADAWYNKGVALGELNKLEEAVACYDKAIEMNPGDAKAWNNKGVALYKLGQTKEALACYDEAVKLKPDYAQAWNNKGVALGNLGQHKEALACFDEAIKLKPDLAEAWVNKGAGLGKLGQPEEALACFDEAIKLKPDLAEAWYSKGVAHGNLGQHKEALACYSEVIELKPDLAEAWNNKGAVLDKLGQPEEALACFDEAIKLKPDFAEAWYNKGEALGKLGLESIRSGDMKEAEERALELVKLKNEADKDGMADVDEAMAEFKEGLSKRELKLFEEFELMLTFLAIEDPFKRWRLLKKEIGKKWPKGVSAVEAIREQRE